MSYFRVIDGGILSLIEDFGRFGLCDKGITNSGVMDEYAYIMANKLLQNTQNTNCIEITLGGLKLQASDSCKISITGADCSCKINSKEARNWRTHNLNKGDIVEFGYAKSGMRIYLAVKGGFKVPDVLGSASVTIKEKLGGLDGDKLKKGDILHFSNLQFFENNTALKENLIPQYKKSLDLRIVLGYQVDFFEKEDIDKFFSAIYTISSQNNRMGYRLEGEAIECKVDGIVSEGICFGAVQIPKDGQPIVLLKDRQTIGGYPKIGSVLPIDCFKLSQLRAGDSVTFKPIEIKRAEKKMELFNSSLLQI